MSNGPNPRATTGVPRLLVSVRSVSEACAAIEGGADIIDIKEPRRGSLGMAAPDVIGAIAEFVRAIQPDIPISAALGELCEIDRPSTALPVALSFVKLGLAGAVRGGDWVARWEAVRRGVVNWPDWVGVAYADWPLVDAPPPDEVITVAADAGCAGILIDTCRKTSGRLTDFVSRDQLAAWAGRAREGNMFIALAGRIAAGDLPALAGIPVDVIAVRSAVCPAHQRNGDVSSDLVALFRQELSECGMAATAQTQPC